MADAMKEGLIEKAPITQKTPRGETEKGQRPVAKKEKVKSDRGTFTIK